MSFFSKFFTKDKKETLDQGLEKTRSSVFEKITRAVAGRSTVDEEVLDDIEEALITSDVGLDTTVKIIEALEERVARNKVMNQDELMQMLYEIISGLMQHERGAWEDFELPKTEGPYVLMVVGVNGVGKTTTIGKLAHQFKNQRIQRSAWRCRYVSCCSYRAIRRMGRSHWRTRSQTGDGFRPGFSSLRYLATCRFEGSRSLYY